MAATSAWLVRSSSSMLPTSSRFFFFFSRELWRCLYPKKAAVPNTTKATGSATPRMIFHLSRSRGAEGAGAGAGAESDILANADESTAKAGTVPGNDTDHVSAVERTPAFPSLGGAWVD